MDPHVFAVNAFKTQRLVEKLNLLITKSDSRRGIPGLCREMETPYTAYNTGEAKP